MDERIHRYRVLTSASPSFLCAAVEPGLPGQSRPTPRMGIMIVRYRTRTQPMRPSSSRAAGLLPAAGDFLSAEVGVQSNGMPLSVISMLSRQDIDVLDEVRYLSTLAREDAVARLTAIIRDAEVDLPNTGGASARASELIALLPDFEADALLPAYRRPERSAPRSRPEPLGKWVGGVAFDENNPLQPPTRAMHVTRLLIVLIACLVLVIIGLVQPRSLESATGGQGSANTTMSGAAPADPSHPRILFH
jgi:hypothetical protein